MPAADPAKAPENRRQRQDATGVGVRSNGTLLIDRAIASGLLPAIAGDLEAAGCQLAR